METLDDLESLWDALLSREPERIRQVFDHLEPLERDAVLTHLKKMSHETGWHPEQQKSAQSALSVLEKFKNS
jgi:hypothetical protein